MAATPRTYAVRRALRSPRAFYRRHVDSDLAPGTRAIYEQFSYSRAIYALGRATKEKPDLLIDFGLDDTSIVIDGGAYVGKWSERISESFGSKVFAFEPNPVPLERLRERLDAYPNSSVFEYGLGARDEDLTLTLRGPGSSVHDAVFDKSGQFETVTVKIRDIVGVFEELQLDHIDLLTLNIEGSEYDVLDRLAEADWFPRIGAFLVQFHEWPPKAHRRRRAIQRALGQTHTQLWDYPWLWEAWQRNVTK